MHEFKIPDKSEAAGLPARVRLEANLGVQLAILPLYAAAIIACFLGLACLPGSRGLGRYFHDEKGLLISLGVAGAFAFSALSIWLLFDNYYVLDSASGTIWIHKGLRFRGTDTLFLEAGQVAAVGLDCNYTRRHGRSHTPVLLTKDGRKIRIARFATPMKYADLDDCNRQTRTWAAALGCYWVKSPGNQWFRVQEEFNEYLRSRGHKPLCHQSS